VSTEILIPALLAFLTGSSLATIIGYFFLRPKTKAEAAKARSEGDLNEVKVQNEIIASLRTHIADQEKRIKGLEEHADNADRREHIVAIFVYEASNWMRRASDTMEPHQRELVGAPPKANPELFVGLDGR
jgi:hypothetical protein